MINNQIVADGGKNRDFSIDILKCLAALLITWSHFEKPLGDFSFLASGGAFGDGLFFFCSGYVLFLSQRDGGFFNWYKRRINRIYPTVFSWALVLCVFFSWNNNFIDVLTCKGYWFVPYIMMFYVLFYPIKKHASNKQLLVVIAVYILLSCIGYCFIDHTVNKQENTWMYWSFFTTMLMGGLVGKNKKAGKKMPLDNQRCFVLLFGLVLCFVLYYAFCYLEGKNSDYHFMRPLNMIFVCGFAYFLFLLCSTPFMERVYHNRYGHAIIMIIGGLCLEIYLVQLRIISDKLNWLFPLNIFVLFVCIFIAAYLLRCFARIWEQTFKEAEYNWKQIIQLY